MDAIVCGCVSHVKPLLAARCYACHGPDANHRKAGLRLDTPEGALALHGARDDDLDAGQVVAVEVSPAIQAGAEVPSADRTAHLEAAPQRGAAVLLAPEQLLEADALLRHVEVDLDVPVLAKAHQAEPDETRGRARVAHVVVSPVPALSSPSRNRR